MYIIKLDAIDSTNLYLKAMASSKSPKDFTVVIAEHQTMGRGQMGTEWYVENGKNLTASVFKRLEDFKIENQFYISMVISLAIVDALNTFKIPKLSIKWPNDILSADKKICGILIENVIKNNKLKGSVIGFGLNVNQTDFNKLPKASSLNLLTGISYDKDEILSEILNKLKHYFNLLENQDFEILKSQYEAKLFRKDKPSSFANANEEVFVGIIKGVDQAGRLKVCTEDDVIKTFDLKELKLLY